MSAGRGGERDVAEATATRAERAAEAAAERAERLARIEAAIEREAPRFDVIPLLDLLRHLGYRSEDIIFESRYSLTSNPGLVHAVEFRKDPSRQVVITLNFGLHDPAGPLPSYFVKLIDDGVVDEQAFLRFLGFFDHLLIQNFVRSIYPEHDPAVYRDWEITKRHYLSLLGLRSPSTLHWLFQSAFPELGVSAERGVLRREVRVAPFRLGASALGRGSLGAVSSVPISASEVTLYCDEEYTERGIPWADEIQRRLRSTIFPVLRDTGIDLRLTLVIWSQRGWARLKPGSYLGFDRIRGGEARRRVVLIHRGPVPRDCGGTRISGRT